MVRFTPLRVTLVVSTVVLVLLAVVGDALAERLRGVFPNLFPFPNPTGVARTFSTLGAIRVDDHPFVESLGTNGRACVHCHVPSDGWSIIPEHLRLRFELTAGTDPVFRPNDGSTSPLADVSTYEARLEAYRLLLTRGLIRVGIGIPPGAEFVLSGVDDPYGYARAAELSLFRRPLPSANLKFLATIMWDGREPSLGNQANDATLGHAQAARSLTAEEQDAIVEAESSLFFAQSQDRAAGPLHADGARGGSRLLASQDFFPGINSGAGFTPAVFTLYDAWSAARGRLGAARQAVARGQAIFNTRTFGPKSGTCGGCHNAPNVGTNSTGVFFNLGLSDESRRTPDLPLYTLECVAGPKVGQIFRTTDPGRALITGRCTDIGRFKAPGLRGLAARAPYFHNGSAARLGDVLDFYDQAFAIGFSAQERADLIAFLHAL